MWQIGESGNPNGAPEIWKTPEALEADFELFLESQKPHVIKKLAKVKKLKESRSHVKRPVNSDYETVIEETDDISEQGLITVAQFARWKGCNRHSLSNNYSQGTFRETYDWIKGICFAYSEERLYEARYNAANIMFAMKNESEWVDKTEHDVNTSLTTPLTPEARAALNKALNGGDEETGY